MELKPSRFGDLRGLGDDLHSVFRRSETGRQEFGFSLLLDDAEAASAEGDEPSIMAESGDSNTDRLGGLKDRLPLLNLYRNAINLQFDVVLAMINPNFSGEWSIGVMG